MTTLAAALAAAALAFAPPPSPASPTPAPTPASAPPAATARTPALSEALEYVRAQHTTGFLVLRDGRVLAEANWPAPGEPGQFRAFAYGPNA